MAEGPGVEAAGEDSVAADSAEEVEVDILEQECEDQAI